MKAQFARFFRFGALALIFSFPSANSLLWADSPTPNTPQITTSELGNLVFTMVPDRKDPGRGTGILRRLEPNGNFRQLWSTSGWYDREVYVANDGHHLVRMGPWSIGSEPEAADLAVAFYNDGKLLRRYSTADLVKDRSRIQRSVSHYMWRGPSLVWDRTTFDWQERQPRLQGTTFTLMTIDEIIYRFDITSGEIIEQKLPSVGPWATERDLRRLALTIALSTTPFPYAKLDEALGLPPHTKRETTFIGGMGPMEELDFSPPNSPTRYVLEVTKSSSALGTTLPDQVLALKLVYYTAEGNSFVITPYTVEGQLAGIRDDMVKRRLTPRQVSEFEIPSRQGP